MLLTLALGKTAPAVGSASHIENKQPVVVKATTKAKPILAEAKKQPKPASRPKVVRFPTGCEYYRNLVKQYAWNVTVALAVMKAESGCNPSALSPTADRGLMQINQVHRAKVGGDLSALFNPTTNIRVAYQVYQGAGWRAWSVCKNGIVACY